MTRRAGTYAFQVAFQSSHYNVAGEYVALLVHSLVSSRELLAWRRTADAERDDAGLAGGLLHLVGPDGPVDLFEWNVADRRRRAETIEDVVQTIERVAVPYFELFVDESAVAERLRTDRIPAFEGLDAIEWLLWRGRREEALAYGRRLLPDAGRRRRYGRMLERARRGESFRGWRGYAEALAYASVTYGLEF